MVGHPGICYMRTTRMDTEPIYELSEEFKIGGSKVLRNSGEDKIAVVSAGVTLYEALNAYEELKKENIIIRVIDAYSVKPIDKETLKKAAKETNAIITVEDHFAQGGLGDSVLEALAGVEIPIFKLAVTKMPRSGKPEELLEYEGISAKAIIEKVKEVLN